MTSIRVGLSTASSLESARSLARQLVEEKLAACVNIVPGVTSIYRWEGAIEESSELLLIIKTTEEVMGALERRLTALHPYDVPEVVFIDPSQVADPYAKWVNESVESAR